VYHYQDLPKKLATHKFLPCVTRDDLRRENETMIFHSSYRLVEILIMLVL
jgi:hypothetical protein